MTPEVAKEFGLIDEVVVNRTWYTTSWKLPNWDLISRSYLY
jgi:hypothetical protein